MALTCENHGLTPHVPVWNEQLTNCAYRTLDGIATAKLQGGLHSGKDSSLETDDLSDCIWAVTVTKISKGFLDSTWNAEPFSKAATFSNAEAPANVDDLLATEYLGDSGIVPLNDGGTLVFLEENNEKP